MSDYHEREAERLVLEWDELAHAASHAMSWEQQRAMLIARIAQTLTTRRPALTEAEVEATLTEAWLHWYDTRGDKSHNARLISVLTRAVLALLGGGK